MSEVQFHIHRKAAFAGALLPYRLYINGQYVGTVYNGKSLHATVERADVYFIENEILSSRNAVLYDSGLSQKNLVLKRAGGWRTESYNEFYIDRGDKLEQLPSFHYERVFDKRRYVSQDEEVLVLCLEFWIYITDDLQEVLASDNVFEIIGALEKIGAQKYHDLLLKIIKEDFCGIQFPMSDEEIEQFQGRIEKANNAIWNNGACMEFRKAIAHFLITRLNDPDYIF